MDDPRVDAQPPEVLEAEWDREQIGALFDDLEQGAQVKHVQVRAAGEPKSRDCQVTLREAKRLLDEGAAQAIQIYYDFEGRTWCDTLMVLPASVRIIRTSGRLLSQR